jgi:anti-sigma factor RsiW
MTQTCGDKSTLVSYLYGECDADERRVIEEHLAACPACTVELEGLQAVRGRLREWSTSGRPPSFELLVQQVPSTSRWTWLKVPVWAQAVAAGLLLAAAAAGLANVEVRYDRNGVVLRTGWRVSPAVATLQSQPQSTSRPAASGGVIDTSRAPWKADLVTFEQQLRQELLSNRPASDPATRTSRGAADDDRLIRRVKSLLDESEQRQRRELALRLAQVVRDFDTQRRADLIRIQDGFGRIEGRTGLEVQQQREMINYLIRVSQKK